MAITTFRTMTLDIRPPAGTSGASSSGTPGNGSRLSFARGEVPVSVQPALAARVGAGQGRRMNAFAGRALTAPVLDAEQAHHGRRLALLNRSLSAGVVDGLGLAFDEAAIANVSTTTLPGTRPSLSKPCWLTLEAGTAVAASGEDVVVPTSLRFDAFDLPVMAPDFVLTGARSPVSRSANGEVLLPRRVGLTLREELHAHHHIPHVGIVVLEPAQALEVQGADTFDQCERDLDAEAFEDQVRADVGRLVYYAWPDEWLDLPERSEAWRNAIAYRVFEREAMIGSSQVMPWHGVGVPLAVIAFNNKWQPLFTDRGAVVRAGGRPRLAMLAGLNGGNAFLWQARIEQFAEHLAEARLAGADTAGISRQVRVLPPAGLLPPDAIAPRPNAGGVRFNHFFPLALDLFAAPVPVEQLDLLLEESAGLSPLDLAVRDRLCVFVPVPQLVYEPDLLVLDMADPDGEIHNALERYIDRRGDWLRRRELLHARQFTLATASDGPSQSFVPLQIANDLQRVEDESTTPRTPAPAGLLHRSALNNGFHQHFFDHAPQPLGVGANDSMFAWVQLDREFPPRTLMLQFMINGSWEQRAYWGENLIPFGVDGTRSRHQVSSELPPPGQWVRLEVSASDVGLGSNAAITGMAFSMMGGRACWGAAGVNNGDGDFAWPSNAELSASAQHGDGEGWDIVAEDSRESPFEQAFGTGVNETRREIPELETLKSDASAGQLMLAPSHADPVLVRDLTKPLADRGFSTIASLIETNGLRATVQDLQARVNEADDAINLGYLRVQTDMYRLRQSVLKQSQATRFAVSPALTQIADLDNATATREQLSNFYDTVKTGTQVVRSEVTPKPVYKLDIAKLNIGAMNMAVARKTSAAPEPTPAPAASVKKAGKSAKANPKKKTLAAAAKVSDTATLVVKARVPKAVVTSNLGFVDTSVQLTAVGGKAGVLLDTGGGSRFGGIFEIDPGIKVGTASPPSPAPAPPSATVTGADALTGKTEVRTSSIASRMERPRSIEAKDFTVATRFEIINRLASLGLDVDDLAVPGIARPREVTDAQGVKSIKAFDPSGQPFRAAPIRLAALRLGLEGNKFTDIGDDPDPDSEHADESAYFLGGVDLSDHTVALLRSAEGIVRRYRDALARCQQVLAAIDNNSTDVAARVDVVSRELAEARQDVATARALLAEEIQRAADVNARRDAIVAEHVKFLAFARPRIGLRSTVLPSRDLDSALEPDAVPACLGEHGDPPSDVAALLAVVRQAPSEWFPAMRKPLQLIDAHFIADAVLTVLPMTASFSFTDASLAFAAPSAQTGTSASAQASQALVKAHAESVMQSRAPLLMQAQASISAGASLLNKVAFIGAAASLGDLASLAAERRELNRRAAEEITRISNIATCLHARLSRVRAALRLEWAEQFSQFDQVGDLGDLSNLPRFGELSRDDREDLRELAAWLRGRVDRSNPRANALMNDLVRVCVLAASHSPAGEILTGRIVKPVPLRPGIRIDIRPHLPDRIRVGMAVHVFDAAQIGARAVVEDLVGGVASVRVTQTLTANFLPSISAGVRFMS